MGFVDVDNNLFNRLKALALLIGLEQDARARNRQLEAFAAHLFDEHAQLQLAAAGDFVGVFLFGLGNLDGDVAFGFAHKARANDARGEFIAFQASEW